LKDIQIIIASFAVIALSTIVLIIYNVTIKINDNVCHVALFFKVAALMTLE